MYFISYYKINHENKMNMHMYNYKKKRKTKKKGTLGVSCESRTYYISIHYFNNDDKNNR